MMIFRMTGLRALVAPMITLAMSVSLPLANAQHTDDVNASDQAQAFTIEHTIKSQFPEQDRLLTVRLPEDYHDEPDAHYPVLYVLDGENNTDFTTSAATFLADSGQIPELIIVGIHSGQTRQVDFAPQAKADRFLDFLEQELFAFVDANYRAWPYRMLSGHSLGGLFATYAMTERPGLFQAHFVQSPAFRGEEMSERVDRLLTDNPDLQGAYYITLGDEPNFEPGFNAMKAALEMKAPASFQWSAERQMTRSHMQTRLVGVYTALEQNFAGDWPLPASLLEEIDANQIKAHMASVAAKYGIDQEDYAVDAMSGAVQSLFRDRNIAGATRMAEVFVAEYPDNFIAHFFLANGYANSGQPAGALEAVNMAIELLEADTERAAESAPILAAMRRMQTQLGGN